jgi:SAM-dependent methyltransferase
MAHDHHEPHGHHGHHGAHGDRLGARQPDRFDPARAAILDDPARFAHVPPERLLDELALAPSATLVDFGAGTAFYAIALARLRPGVRIVALDEQPAMLAYARDAIAAAGVADVEVAGPSALAALRGMADGVLALNVLHELGDAALADLKSLLAPNGTAVFADWNAAVERPVGPPRDHVYDPDEAARRLEAAGFRVDVREPLPYHFVLIARTWDEG